MRLAWATDIHLDKTTPAVFAKFVTALRDQRPDHVVLTGDLSEAPTVEVHVRRLAEAVKAPVSVVFGNHDFYGGSIAQVRREAAAWSFARYLPKHGVVTLAPGVALVGVDGWGDCRYGNHNGSPVVVNDFFRVRELRENYVRKTHRAYLRTLGKREGERLEGLLKEAVRGHRRVIVATHVPPFEEATWHDGKASGPDHTPFFACKSTGEALLGVAALNRQVTFTVLCGHVHGGGIVQKGANLVVRTGAASYGFPQPQEPLDL